MSDDASLPPLPELHRDDLLPEPRDLAEVVVSRGGGGGVGLLEAFLHCYFEQRKVKDAYAFYTQVVPVIESRDEHSALRVWGRMVNLMTEVAGERLSNIFHARLAEGMFTVSGIAAGQSHPATIPLAVAQRGRLSVWQQTLSDHRTRHANEYSCVTLTPTVKAIKLFPEFDQLAAFTAALDTLECWAPGEVLPNGRVERLIKATKKEIHLYLDQQHPRRFGKLATFTTNFSTNGEKGGRLPYPIKWMNDRRLKSD